MIKVDWNPPARQLRVFSVACLVFGGLLGVWLVWRHGCPVHFAGIAWGIGAAAGVTGLIAPPAVRPLYVVLTAVALPIGFTVSGLVLVLLYYLLLTPIGLVMRLLGRDPMRRRFDRGAESYWIPRSPIGDMRRYFRQH